MTAPRSLHLTATLLCVASLASATVLTPPAPRSLALVGGTVHTVNAGEIPNGTVLVENGRITAVGASIAAPSDATVIDCRGKHVYPGFVAANTQLGLVEINTVLGADDTQETGNVNPNIRAEVMINPDSDLLPVTRVNGVTSALVIPGGGSVRGTSAVMHLDGWTYEDMTVRAPVGLHVQWPNMSPIRAWFIQQSDEEQLKARDAAIQAIRTAFEDAKAYAKARAAEGQAGVPKHDADFKWDGMRKALAGEIPVFVHADNVAQIRAALNFFDEQGLSKLVLVGGYDAWRLADELKARGIPVIIAGVLATPTRRYEPYDEAFTVAKKLRDAGVRFCIADDGGAGGAANARNVPYHAAMAAAFGLPREEALKAVTLYPAQILGVGDKLGSIEVGKQADLQITNGDALEQATVCEQVIIEGRVVPMVSRQTRLFEKYDARARGPKARRK